MNRSKECLVRGLLFLRSKPKWFKISIGLICFALGLNLANVLLPVSLEPKQQARIVVAENGLPLRKFADEQGVWRYPVQIENLSPLYIDILLNYEDRYFYHHFGINPIALVRAAWQWGRYGRIISGGSTISMQVARLVRPTRRTVWGKLLQILTALQLEWRYSKQEILTYYINHAPFGGRIEGVEAASLFYFGYSAKKLTYAQAALLAVLPQSPTRNRPDRHPEVAKQARNKVLRRMRGFGEINETEYLEYKLEEIQVAEEFMPTLAPLLSRRLAKNSNSELVQTTIDYDKQWTATEAVKSYVQGLGDKVSASVLVAENKSGEVKVYIGSADFKDNRRFAHVDMVRAKRSPGSTLKPFIYAMALEQGLIHSHSLLMDIPLKFADYFPENFNDMFNGPVSAASALTSSLNVPAVQLLEQLSPREFYALMVNAGVKLDLPKHAKPNLSIALGGVSTSLEGLVAAYMALANNGTTMPLKYLRNTLEAKGEGPEKLRSALLPIASPEAAWVIKKMLMSPSSSSQTSLQRNLSQRGYAVKTGTSAGHKDVWAIASGEVYTIGVWLGRPDNGNMTGHQGSDTAVPLLEQIASVLGTVRLKQKQPARVSQKLICWPLGQRSSHDCLKTHNAWIIDEQIPKTLMSIDYKRGSMSLNELEMRIANDSGLRLSMGCDIEGRINKVVLWPDALEQWLPQKWRNEKRVPKQDPRCKKPDTYNQLSHVSIIGVENEQVIWKVADQSLPQIKLTASNPSGDYYWYVNGRLQEGVSAPITLNLSPQSYQVTLLDQLGKVAKVSFTVKE